MELTHFDEHGKAVMVDVTDKQDTVREATAAGKITVSQAVYEAVEQGKIGKGDVLGVATTGADPHVPYPAHYQLQDTF